MISTWMKDATYGVNAQLDLLTSDGLIPVGDTQPPDLATIADSVDDRWVIRGNEEPPNKPALVITHDRVPQFGGEIGTDRRTNDLVQISLRYFTIHGDEDQAVQDTAHTLRAIVRSLKVFNSNAQEDARKLNQIVLKTCTQILAGPWREKVGNALVSGAVVSSYDVIDLKP